MQPFQLCPLNLGAQMGLLHGQIAVRAPGHPAFAGNLSALEIEIESVQVAETDERLPHAWRTYATLSDAYGEDRLEDSVWFSAEASDALSGMTPIGLQGRLVVRLPTELGHLTLDVSELGNRGTHDSGLDVRLVGVHGGELELDLAGPRDRIVQFVPRDEDGNALATNNVRIEASDDPERWRGTMAVSGRPATLDVVFAAQQERLDYPFELSIDP